MPTPTPHLARRARNHLATALVALQLLVPFASARAAAVAGARVSAAPDWECVLGIGYFFTKIPYELDTDLAGYLWEHCW